MTVQAEADRYLLLAGTDRRLDGRLDGVVARFAGEAEAREAFLAVRLSPAYRDGWAELVGIGEGGQPRPLCWFGARTSPVSAVTPGPRGPSMHHPDPLRTQGDDVFVPSTGGTMQTKEQERIVAAAGVPGPRKAGRSRMVAALVAALAAAALAVGVAVAGGDTADRAPAPAPVPVEQILPSDDVPPVGRVPSAAPHGAMTFEG